MLSPVLRWLGFARSSRFAAACETPVKRWMASAAQAAALEAKKAYSTKAHVSVLTQGTESAPLRFGECLLGQEGFSPVRDALGHDVATVSIHETGCRQFVISPWSGTGAHDSEAGKHPVVPLSHAPECPLCLGARHGKPIADTSNHWRAGAVVVLESEGSVLLVKRPSHMRSFPGIWVAPGGHIDDGESSVQAAARELKEEAGVDLGLAGDGLHPLCAWVSTYPATGPVGAVPKRQHFVMLYRASLPPASEAAAAGGLRQRVQLQPEEVEAAVWVDREQVESVLAHTAAYRRRVGLLPRLQGVACTPPPDLPVPCSVVNGTGLAPTMTSTGDIASCIGRAHVFALQCWLDEQGGCPEPASSHGP